MSKKIHKQNTRAINKFFTEFDDSEVTKKDISKLLVRLQGLFFSQPGVSLDDDYKDRVAYQFESLFDLVNDLQPVEK